MATKQMTTDEDIRGYMTSLSNWGRWGPDDQLGTLNLITQEKRAQAGGLVRKGISVSCSRPIVSGIVSDTVHCPPMHYMVRSGGSAPSSGSGASTDFIGIHYHGHNTTHIDSLAHAFWDGKMYNGKPASLVSAEDKATFGGIEPAAAGVVTRGILLDFAKLRGKEWLDEGEGIFPEDLEAAESAQGVRLEEGDALLLRTGWAKKREVMGPPTPPARPGLNGACLPWLHQRGVSITASDASQDVSPSGYSGFRNPVHEVGIVTMGLWLIDSADFEGLAKVCGELNRWEFMFMVAPLVWIGATGGPVNPLAIF